MTSLLPVSWVSHPRFKVRAVLVSLLFLSGIIAACSESAVNRREVDDEMAMLDGVTLQTYRDHAVMIPVPPGNRNPALSWSTLFANLPGRGTVTRTEPNGTVTVVSKATSTKKTFETWENDPQGLRAELDRRFTRTFRAILKDKGLKAALVEAGRAHDIDPVLILSCVLGEGTFNVGLTDDIQTLAVVSAKWAAKWALRFRSNGVDLAELLKKPEFGNCDAGVRAGGSHATYWDCVGQVWRKSFMGKPVEPGSRDRYPMNDLKWTFFNPLGSGFTYGLGQLDPIRALMVTDVVNRKAGLRLLSVERPEEIYEDIIHPRSNIHYVAANVRLMVETYAGRANFDISKNPGIVASLYNLGGEGGRANSLFRTNLDTIPKGSLTLPMENYYGFYINEKESLIRQAFDRWTM